MHWSMSMWVWHGELVEEYSWFSNHNKITFQANHVVPLGSCFQRIPARGFTTKTKQMCIARKQSRTPWCGSVHPPPHDRAGALTAWGHVHFCLPNSYFKLGILPSAVVLIFLMSPAAFSYFSWSICEKESRITAVKSSLEWNIRKKYVFFRSAR